VCRSTHCGALDAARHNEIDANEHSAILPPAHRATSRPSLCSKYACCSSHPDRERYRAVNLYTRCVARNITNARETPVTSGHPISSSQLPAKTPVIVIKKGESVLGPQRVSLRHRTDVFVVGGGPAGLAAAIAARQKGLDVIVADGATPPIEKPCGEGLLPETLGSLRSLGVEARSRDAQELRGISFVQEDAQVCADFPQETGVGLRRPRLHELLVARAEQCGVQLLWKTPVRSIDARGVQLANETITARWIIGADGQGSRVRRWSGLDNLRRIKKRHATRRHFRVPRSAEYMQIFWGEHAQAYVTPIAEEEVCVVVMSEHPEYAGFERALRELPQLQLQLRDAETVSRERGAISVMCSLQNVQRGNVALIGDASGGVDAITGEGLRLAFRQAFALADAMVSGNLKQYETAHRKLARRPMLMGHLMLLLGRHPRIRGRVLRALQSNPDLFARLVATHAGHASPAQLFTTGASLGWHLLAT